MGLLERLGLGRRDGPVPPGPLADLLAAPVVPEKTPLREVELVALDLETTGLDPRKDELLSVGLMPVHRGEILLGGALHLPVRPRGDVGDSAVLHGLTDDALADAPSLSEVLPEVLDAFTTSGAPAYRRVLLAHFSQVETRFLTAACRAVYGAGLRLQVVDTLEVERRVILRAGLHELEAGQVRLDACRRRRRLPRYQAHSAVTDALACAELFLAQCAEVEEQLGRELTLADLVERT